ncbi:SCO2400 family protein [Streptomyces yangpuensis]|uniref:SCO2400 family protein n=1 Tax=Streptomyces yangpuensis TaxID=1648182 RepID=UPI0035DCFEC7
MNYCHACRRHLNGALACAGCGTPAEYLIPAAPTAGPPQQPAVEGPAADPPAALADVFADSLVVLSAPDGRRSGARRRAANRRRRRTVVSLSLGVLLAAAASLTVAGMAADGERTDRASDVVLTDDAPREPAPLPDAPTAGAPTGPGKATVKAPVAATKKAGSPAPSESVAQPGPTGAASSPAPTSSVRASRTPGPGTSVQGSGSGSPSPGGSPTPTSTGTPAPEPTKDCWIFCGWF